MDDHKWKRYFLYLLFSNLIILGILSLLLFWPKGKNPLFEKGQSSIGDHSEFLVQTDKKHLNQLINAYLEQSLKDQNYQFHVTLEEDVHLQGEIPIFSTTVPLSIRLNPYVLEDGNLLLKQTSIFIGQLRLPNHTVLKYVDRLLPIPEWITIHPDYEEIYIAITHMNIKSNFELEVESFDLQNNDLAFKIKIPYKTLGIRPLETKNQRE